MGTAMAICPLCKMSTLDPRHEIEHFVMQSIMESHPEWVDEDGCCEKCIEYYESLDHPAYADRLAS